MGSPDGPEVIDPKLPANITGVSRDLATGLAAGAAGAAARSLIEGSDFGDNLVAALPDIIGTTIGNAIAGGVARDTKAEGNGGTLNIDRSKLPDVGGIDQWAAEWNQHLAELDSQIQGIVSSLADGSAAKMAAAGASLKTGDATERDRILGIVPAPNGMTNAGSASSDAIEFLKTTRSVSAGGKAFYVPEGLYYANTSATTAEAGFFNPKGDRVILQLALSDTERPEDGWRLALTDDGAYAYNTITKQASGLAWSTYDKGMIVPATYWSEKQDEAGSDFSGPDEASRAFSAYTRRLDAPTAYLDDNPEVVGGLQLLGDVGLVVTGALTAETPEGWYLGYVGISNMKADYQMMRTGKRGTTITYDVARFAGANDQWAGRIDLGTNLLSAAAPLRLPGGISRASQLGRTSATEGAATVGSRATLDAASRNNLLSAVQQTGSLSEAKGLVYAQREGMRLGYDSVLPSLTYRGPQGIDLALQSSATGRYAVWEAKGGFSQTSLSALSTDARGLTQGSLDFIDTRLDRYIRYGDGANLGVARNLQGALGRGNLDSFASFYGSRRTYQLPLTGAGVRPAFIAP